MSDFFLYLFLEKFYYNFIAVNTARVKQYLSLQEIHNTMRMSQELAKHSIWLHRINNKDSDETESCPIRQENKRRLNLLLNELKVRIRPLGHFWHFFVARHKIGVTVSILGRIFGATCIKGSKFDHDSDYKVPNVPKSDPISFECNLIEATYKNLYLFRMSFLKRI